MNATEKQQFEQMKQDIADLKRWQEERKRQQISLPLDEASVAVLNEHFMRIFATATYTNHSDREFTDYIGRQGGQSFKVPKNELFQYIADVSTDTLTVEGNPFIDGDRVYLYTSGTAPGGLNATSAASYVITNTSGNSFQVYNFSDGTETPINITSTGSGNQFIAYF